MKPTKKKTKAVSHAGAGLDAELMGWFLRAEGGPLTPDMRDRLDSLNDAEGSCDDGAEEFDCVDYLGADGTCDDGAGGLVAGSAGSGATNSTNEGEGARNASRQSAFPEAQGVAGQTRR